MKFFTLALLTLVSFNTFTSTNLEDQKVITNNALDAAISRLEDHKPCVKKAKSVEELKKCRERLGEDMMSMRTSILETRKEIKQFHKKKESSKL